MTVDVPNPPDGMEAAIMQAVALHHPSISVDVNRGGSANSLLFKETRDRLADYNESRGWPSLAKQTRRLWMVAVHTR